jgi:CheY-like chemotaxis protein
MDGFEFLQEFERIPWPGSQKPLVVLLTTSANPTDLSLAKNYQLADYLNKPLNTEKLTALMLKHF